MARIRTIKPAFFRHGDLYDAEVETQLPLRLAFAGLWTVADRAGRFEWDPRELKLDCLPYDPVDFSRVLDALVTRGFVTKYEIHGVAYGVIPSFARHQIVNNRESASALPPPPETPLTDPPSTTSTRDARVHDAWSTRHDPAQGEQEQEQEQERVRTRAAKRHAAGPLAGSLPRDHIDHGFCGSRGLCVPTKTVDQLARRYGTGGPEAVLGFLQRLNDDLGEHESPGGPVWLLQHFDAWLVKLGKLKPVPTPVPPPADGVPDVEATRRLHRTGKL